MKLSAAAFLKCSTPAHEQREREELGLPRAASHVAIVLPELHAIFYPIAKCASTALVQFFARGPKPLFRFADRKHDGMGAMYEHFVKDLGETEESRRMKRNFFSFAFVCHPLKRLVSAYGTINRRSSGGAVVMNGDAPAIAWPPFTQLARSREPQRFQQFVKDLHVQRLTSLELWPYRTSWSDTRQLPLAENGQHWRIERLNSSDDHAMSKINHVFSLPARSMQRYASLAAAYRSRNASAMFDVEGSVVGTWSHATSQTSLLPPYRTDSDGTPRRLDFLGRVETVASDLRKVLAALNVSDDQLSQVQKSFLEGKVHDLWANPREGFKGLPSTRYRIADHVTLGHLHNTSKADKAAGDATRQRILARYRADFECLNYSLQPSREEMQGLFGYHL
jgi:hypothetical protein